VLKVHKVFKVKQVQVPLVLQVPQVLTVLQDKKVQQVWMEDPVKQVLKVKP
jgi:hypothetical protein